MKANDLPWRTGSKDRKLRTQNSVHYFKKCWETLEKLAGDKLLQLPVEPFFTKHPVKLLDILNVDCIERCSKSDMKWKILLRYTEEIKYPHLSVVFYFKILNSNKNPGSSIKKFAAEGCSHSSPFDYTFFLVFLVCLHFVKRLFKSVHQILTKQPSH